MEYKLRREWVERASCQLLCGFIRWFLMGLFDGVDLENAKVVD